MAHVLRKPVKKAPWLTHDFRLASLQPAPGSSTPDHRPWGTNVSDSHPKPPNRQEAHISFFSASPSWKKGPPGDSSSWPGDDDGLAWTPFCWRDAARGSHSPFLLF